MGYWRIVVEGHGCHHNNDPRIDADKATRAFVETLALQGHGLTEARFLMVPGPSDMDIDFLHKEPDRAPVEAPVEVPYVPVIEEPVEHPEPAPVE